MSEVRGGVPLLAVMTPMKTGYPLINTGIRRIRYEREYNLRTLDELRSFATHVELVHVSLPSQI